MFGYVNIVPLAVGLGLFQIGEFSFVLARVGLGNNAIDSSMYSFILATSVISMIATPFVSALTVPLYHLKKRLFKHESLQTENIPREGLHQHVIICGGGRVGQHVARILAQLNVPFVIAELNHQRMVECKKSRFPTIYGDISQHIVQEAACIHEASLLLITIPSVLISQAIAKMVLSQRAGLHIVARAEGVEQSKTLYDKGIYMVVLPELEAGLEIARQTLLHLKIPATVIQQYTDAVRQQHYAPIYEKHYDYRLMTKLDNAKDLLEVYWVTMTEGCKLIGVTIGQSNIRSRTGASVVGVITQGGFKPNPKADYRFMEGDLVAILGNHEERDSFKELAGLAV
jgi:CPA2 family monovalent cation:H+ antiporter-2